MPPKKEPQTPEQQADQFRREAQKLIDAGELSPTEGDSALDQLVRRGVTERKGSR